MKKNFKLYLNKLINYLLIVISLKIFQFIFDFLLHLSLKAKGYKNFGDLYLTGENNFINIIRKHKIKLSLDVGANIGEYSKKILEKTNSKVIAFEPDKSAFKILKKLDTNYLKRFKAYNYALSDKNQYLNFYFTGAKSQLSSLEKNISKLNYIENSKLKKKKIKCFKGDNLLIKKMKITNIDFIKVDTEGHDLKVLKGLKKIISNSKTKFIQFEMNWHNLFSNSNLYQFALEFKDYDLYRILPYKSGILKIDVNHPDNNLFHLSNYVLVRKDIKIN